MAGQAKSSVTRERAVDAALVALLLTVHLVLAMTSMAQKSATYDEPVKVLGGHVVWHERDFRISPQSAVLTHYLAGLGLMAADYTPPDLESPHWRRVQPNFLADRFFFGQGNDPEALMWATRIPMVLFSVLGGLVVYLLARRGCGRWGGLLALVFYAASPTILAHARLVTSDLPLAVLFLAAIAGAWALMHRVTPGRVAWVVAAFAIGALAKFSAVLLAPMAVVLLLARVARGGAVSWRVGPWRGRRRGRVAVGLHAAAVVLLAGLSAWGGVWTAYGFRHSVSPQGTRHEVDMMFDRQAEVVANERGDPKIDLALWLGDTGILPEACSYGLAFVFHFSLKRNTFLAGEYSLTGDPAFFPIAFAIKTPPTLMIGLVAALLGLGLTWRRVQERFGGVSLGRVWRSLYRAWPLWTVAVVYMAVALRSNLNIGHRHMLPVYPVLFVACGVAAGLGRWDTPAWRRVAGGGVVVLAVAHLGLAVWVWPHYLAYFNSLVGGPAGGRQVLVDSSLDWGQDLPGLRDWLEAEYDPQRDGPVYLGYFGSARPEGYGVRTRRLRLVWSERMAPNLPVPLEPGVYAVSVTARAKVYAPAWGQWTAGLENSYRQHLGELQALTARRVERARAGRDAAMAVDAALRRSMELEILRNARLMAYLRQRMPDDHVGHSILIYRLNADQLREALLGPPPELGESPR